MFNRKSNREKAESKITMVRLKNGSEVPELIVKNTMENLSLLMKKNIVGFHELVQKCKKPEHKMFGNTEKDAAKLGLIDSNGCHSSTRDIVLSAVVGEDLLQQSLGDPIAPEFILTRYFAP